MGSFMWPRASSSMKSLLALLLLALGLFMAFAPASAEAASPRMRRSVNFTPSWGKRSGHRPWGEEYVEKRQRPPMTYVGCAKRSEHLEMLADAITVELESLSDCLSEK